MTISFIHTIQHIQDVVNGKSFHLLYVFSIYFILANLVHHNRYPMYISIIINMADLACKRTI